MAVSNIGPYHAWFYLTRRFERLLENLAISSEQSETGESHHLGVRRALNRHYYDLASETANSMLTGSWAKQLRVRPPRDVDVLFILPNSVWHRRYGERSGNRQSQLLQEIKGVLFGTYPETRMRGDGQAVVVDFASMPVEVVPAFTSDDGQILVCDAEGGGRFQVTDPAAEINALRQSDEQTGGATRAIIRILKQWQRHCDVPLKSFLIERLVIEFFEFWPFTRHIFWVDWMLRDLFEYILNRSNGYVTMPGTLRQVPLGETWTSKARVARDRASRACDYERDNENLLAGLEWQVLFGSMIPQIVE